MRSKINVKDILDSIKGDLGEDDYLEPLEVLVDSLNEEANLSYFGVLGAKFQISNHLKTRVKILDYVKTHSLSQPVAQVVQEPRSRGGCRQ